MPVTGIVEIGVIAACFSGACSQASDMYLETHPNTKKQVEIYSRKIENFLSEDFKKYGIPALGIITAREYSFPVTSNTSGKVSVKEEVKLSVSLTF